MSRGLPAAQELALYTGTRLPKRAIRQEALMHEQIVKGPLAASSAHLRNQTRPRC